MITLKQSVARNVLLKLYLTSDHVTAATGKTVTVTISKDGAAFAAISGGAGAVSELTNGWYKIVLSTTDTNTLGELAIRGTATSCDDAERVDEIVSYNPQSATNLGLSNLDVASSTLATAATAATLATAAAQTSLATALNVVDDFLDTEILAIKTKTDLIPATPLVAGDIPTAAAIRTEIDTNSTKLSVAVSTRMASFTYTAPDSAATIATAVWANATRTLSSFGTLVADVWASAARTLTAQSDSAGVTTLLARPASPTAVDVWASAARTLTAQSDSSGVTTLLARPASPTAAQVRTEVDSNSTELAAIKLKTALIPASPAAVGDIPSVGSIATAVWASAARTLTSFGTVVDDIWSSAARTLTAFGIPVTVETNNDKTGYALVDSIPTVAQIRSEIDSSSTELAAIKSKTNLIPATPADAIIISSDLLAIATSIDEVKAFVDTEILAIQTKTANLPADPASAATLATQFSSVTSALTSLSTSIGAQVSDIKAKTDLLAFTGADVNATLAGEEVALSSATKLSLVETILKTDLSTITGEDTRSLINAIRFLRNRWTLIGTTLTVYKEDDATIAWTAVVTKDATAEPITGTNPA